MSWKKAIWVPVGIVLLIVASAMGGQCWTARLRYGVKLETCPTGRMQPELTFQGYNLRRGAPGVIRVRPQAVYTTGWSRGVARTPIWRGAANVSLITGSSTVALTPKDGWSRDGGGELVGRVTLPAELPDGQHRLVVSASTPLGPVSASAPFAVFAPARILVMTDRPLYEAGNVVRFRAVVVRSKDGVPLDGRPGEWHLKAPDGTVVLEERSATEAYGVVAGDFPLDAAAPSGVWSLEWRSDQDKGATTFRVEPFELPRFSIEARSVRPHYGPRGQPVVRGAVRYASGAPVVGAALDIEWQVSGRWPPPTSWLKDGLPTQVVADAQGRFELVLPQVPNDLVGQAILRGRLAATDATGDRVPGIVAVLLSKDDIGVTTVTELAGGLVEGFNNRLYLRATTASGAVLRSTKLKVTRAWDPTDEGLTVTTDVDGVAAVQIDPGPAVTVVEPGMPVRPPPPPEPVVRTSLTDHLRDQGPTLADKLILDKAGLGTCARLAANQKRVTTKLWVSPGGKVESVFATEDDLSACVAGKLRRLAFGRGRARLLDAEHEFNWSGPRLEMKFEGPDVLDAPWRPEVERLAVQARRCLPADVTGRPPGRLIGWSVANDRLRWRSLPEPRTTARQPARVTDCLVETFGGLDGRTAAALKWKAATASATGLIRMRIVPAPRRSRSYTQNRTYLGYELRVEALADDERIGTTTVRLRPGQIPPLRLRSSPVVAGPGSTVEVKVLRGPAFTGELPETLTMTNEGRRFEAPLDPKTRVARFALPEDRAGWYEVRLYDARTIVFVPEPHQLTVTLTTDKPKYRPGDRAELAVRTTALGRPIAAMVGLFGVDQTLGQLAPLAGPGVWSQLLVTPEMASPAFGAIDAVALASGRVRGPDALAATVLRVTKVPAAEANDRAASVMKDSDFDPVIPLTDTFYELLARLVDRVRAWDAEAPPAEQMTPAKMAELWNAVRAEAPAEYRDDPFGRPMRLTILPDDLLALVDPRAVVTNGTRLPEDVVNWIRWVRRNER